MVAVADYFGAFVAGDINSSSRKFGSCAVYLYPFLRDNMKREEAGRIIVVISTALLMCYLIFGHKFFLLIALVLNILNIFENRLTFYIAEYWMRFASLLGKINSRIILFLFFYIIFTPFSFLYRVFNPKLVRHFKDNEKESFFDDVEMEYDKKSFEKTW